MRKIILLILTVFLLVPMATAISGDVNLGLTTFDSCGTLIFYNAFNQSDSSTIQNALTGQAMAENTGDMSIKDQKLLLDGAEGGDILGINQDLNVGTHKNYTIDIVFQQETHSGFLNNWFGLHQSGGVTGTEQVRYPTVTTSNAQLELAGSNLLSPTTSLLNIQNTVWLFRLFYSGQYDIINGTLYNITGTPGNYVLNRIATLQMSDSRADTVQSVSLRQTTASSAVVNVSEMAIYVGKDCRVLSQSDTTQPAIVSYNMTSGGSCTNWITDKNNACTTSDTTPTVFIETDEPANCRMGILNKNYTDLGISRECDGGGTQQLTCTIIPQDQLTEEASFVYIGCEDMNNHQNQTSTSGALKMSIFTSDLESRGRYGIETGAQVALTSGYTIYTDQKIYARNSANNQSIGTFDKVVKWLNKVWAFNFLTGNDTAVGMFNITPVLYTLEIRNMTNSTVNTTVYNFIQATR